MTDSEYHNGHGHANGNGNGNGKAFVLTQPKTPAQIKRESNLAKMPELRRNCSRDRRLGVGPKWFFGQLTDLSFLYNFGGNGNGIVYTSIKDLVRIYGHDEESFEKWRDKLIGTGWIWFIKNWPDSQWGICGVAEQPELHLPFTESELDRNRIYAKAGITNPTNPDLCQSTQEPEDSGMPTPQNPVTNPEIPGAVPGSTGLQTRQNRLSHPEKPGGNGRENRAAYPVEPDTKPDVSGFVNREQPETTPDKPPQLQESPIGDGSNGAIEGEPPSPISMHELAFKRWEESLSGKFDSKLEAQRKKFIEQLERIPNLNADSKAMLRRKIRVLDERLEGPQPERVKAAVPLVNQSAPASKASPEEIARLQKALKESVR